MKKSMSIKRTLLTSMLAMLICVTTLVGATFAWFTDSTTSAGNKIQAGSLDVQLLMYSDADADYINIGDSSAPIFGNENSLVAQNNNADTLWEPGKTQVVYLAIKNNGTLALKYTVALDVDNVKNDLYEVMEYTIVPDAKNGEAPKWDATKGIEVVEGRQQVSEIVPLLKGETHYFALTIHMNEDAGNKYQMGQVDFDISVFATQYNYEPDSFDNTYDEGLEMLVQPVTIDNNTPTSTITSTGGVFTEGEVIPGAVVIKDYVADTDSVLIATETTVSTIFLQNVNGTVRDHVIINNTPNTIVIADCSFNLPDGCKLVLNTSGDTTMLVALQNVYVNGVLIERGSQARNYLENVTNVYVIND